MGIKELIATGPYPRYQLRTVALQNYHDIAKARELRHPWPEIALALGLPRDRWPGLARAWRKVGKDYGGNPPGAMGLAEKPSPAPRQKLPRIEGNNKTEAQRILATVQHI